MPLALILPATLLGYLAGIAALVLGVGWLACLGIVALTGLGTVLGIGILLAVRSGPPARAPAAAPSTLPSARAPS
jgi:hypothetical protein